MRLRPLTTQAPPPPTSFVPRLWEPRPHDAVAVRWLLKHPEAALFSEPGLGKTTQTLAAFLHLRQAGAVHKMLVVAPLRVAHLVWSHDEEGELGQWANFQGLRVALLHGPRKAEAWATDADLYVINWEGLSWLCSRIQPNRTRTYLDDLLARGVDMVTYDELSRLKNTSTQRFRLLKPFFNRFRRRVGLTGSAAANGLLGLFGQVYALDLGRALGQYVTHYRLAYFSPVDPLGYVWKPKPGGEKAIYQALKDVALSQRVGDHLKLKEPVSRTIHVDLPPEARRVHDELLEELLTMLDDETVTAANKAVALNKCRQVASGGLYVTEGGSPLLPVDPGTPRRTVHLHDAKTEALQELVEELQGSPLLVIYEFNHDLERIRRAFPNVPVVGGSPNGLKELIARWNRGEIVLLAGHPASMGHGLNMQRGGHHLCWYTPPWDYELYDQTNRRLYRSGQAETVIKHHLAARKTIEQYVLAQLRAKATGQNALMAALRRTRQHGQRTMRGLP